MYLYDNLQSMRCTELSTSYIYVYWTIYIHSDHYIEKQKLVYVYVYLNTTHLLFSLNAKIQLLNNKFNIIYNNIRR